MSRFNTILCSFSIACFLLATSAYSTPNRIISAKKTGIVKSFKSKKKRYKRRSRQTKKSTRRSRYKSSRYKKGRSQRSRSNKRRYSKKRRYKRRRHARFVSRRFVRPGLRALSSSSVAVMDQRTGSLLYSKNINKQRAIASVTKLMTAMVILDSKLRLDQPIRISYFDKDFLRFSRSRLRVGTLLRRKDLIFMALAASENRASHALARTYPGGRYAFIRAMNRKARLLGMTNTHFSDSSGLSSGNRSTARDLLKMVRAAYNYPLVREFTTSGRGWAVDLSDGRIIQFMNTNRLVRRDNWSINVSKTGFIREAGYCLVMHTNINNRKIIMVLLNSGGKYTKFGDANRVRKWLAGKSFSSKTAKATRNHKTAYNF